MNADFEDEIDPPEVDSILKTLMWHLHFLLTPTVRKHENVETIGNCVVSVVLQFHGIGTLIFESHEPHF